MRLRSFRSLGGLLLVAAIVPLVAPLSSAGAEGEPGDPLEGLAIPSGPITIDRALTDATGPVQVVVQLARPPLSKAVGGSAKQLGAALTARQQKEYGKKVSADQDAFLASARNLGASVQARVSIALNAVVITLDASKVADLGTISGVTSIRPVGRYEMALDETVPYIGATALQNTGVDGSGIRVAVLDSGIDFTHFNLGGPGTVAAYNECYAGRNAAVTGTCATLFGPAAAKVKGGYDFVGETWPTGALAPDPNPIDFQGHGTHVADIIAGRSADGVHKGVAPGAAIYSAKVCSAVASSCSGVALLQAMDFALDPDGDGSISDAVDVINMSLGSSYGQIEDDLSGASANAVAMGVTVVVSAGNSADRPYILGSPSSTPGVISVAQTQVPSATSIPLVVNSPANIAGTYTNTATLDFAPIGAGATGNVVWAGTVGSANGCSAFTAGAFTGKVALIDRGACAVSLKVDNAARAGAIGVLIGLVAPGDAVTFSYGGGTQFVPSLVITQAVRNLIQAEPADTVNVTLSTTNASSLAPGIVGSSSRGPSYSFDAIKPDIGAPGASVSAVVGTGNGEGAFGGTSGAAPMVSGAAALLLDTFGPTAPHVVKARLMGSAETVVYQNKATQPGVLAPISRIGGGEVRVDKAAALTTVAWAEGDNSARAASLSFGFTDAAATTTISKRLIVSNMGTADVTYSIAPTFRYADDAASGAVAVTAPSKVTVKKGTTKSITVTMRIDPTKLPAWNLSGGSVQGDGSRLQAVEFDGYLHINSGSQLVTVPWHVLPRKAAAVSAPTSLTLTGGAGAVLFSNSGAQSGAVNLFGLDGVDDKDYPKPFQAAVGDNFVTPDIKAVGSRVVGSTAQFAVNFWSEWSHPSYPQEVDIYIDSNRDGTDDYVVYTAESGGFAATGQTLVNVVNLTTGSGGAYFYLDADLNASNMILTVPLGAVGLTAGTQFDYSVYVYDNYFTGNLTDAAGPFTVTLSLPKYSVSVASGSVASGGTGSIDVTATPGGDVASPTQLGVLALYRSVKAKDSATAIIVS